MRVIWTEEAKKRFEFIMTCSRDFYSKKALRTLNDELKQYERILLDYPRLGQIETYAEGRDYEYRHIILSSPFKVIYFLYEDDIYVADIWDTRQDPSTLVEHLA